MRRAFSFCYLIFLLSCPLFPAQAQQETPSAESLIFESINELRQARGQSRLVLDDKLVKIARSHSQDLLSLKQISHLGSDQQGPDQRAELAGYDWLVVLENIAEVKKVKPVEVSAEVLKIWTGSTEHLDNILDIRVVDIGVGLAFRDGRNIVTVVLGKD